MPFSPPLPLAALPSPPFPLLSSAWAQVEAVLDQESDQESDQEADQKEQVRAVAVAVAAHCSPWRCVAGLSPTGA